MTVKELIEQLKTMPQDLPVYCMVESQVELGKTRASNVTLPLGFVGVKVTVESKGRENLDPETQFERLVDEWEKDTRNISSNRQKALHPAHLAILAMKDSAIPLILRRLKRVGGNWSWTLIRLTKENPVRPQDEGNLERVRAAWLKWGKNHGYLNRKTSTRIFRNSTGTNATSLFRVIP